MGGQEVPCFPLIFLADCISQQSLPSSLQHPSSPGPHLTGNQPSQGDGLLGDVSQELGSMLHPWGALDALSSSQRSCHSWEQPQGLDPASSSPDAAQDLLQSRSTSLLRVFPRYLESLAQDLLSAEPGAASVGLSLGETSSLPRLRLQGGVGSADPPFAPQGPPSLLTAGHNGGDAGHGFAPEAQAGIRERGDAKNRLLSGSVYPEPSRGNAILASPPHPDPPCRLPSTRGGQRGPHYSPAPSPALPPCSSLLPSGFGRAPTLLGTLPGGL